MTARTKTLTALSLAFLIATGAALGWLYTRPVMTDAEIEDIRARAAALSHPRADAAGATVAPPIDCAPYVRERERMVQAAMAGGRPAPPEEERHLATLAGACIVGLEATTEHLLAPPDVDTGWLSDAGNGLIEDAEEVSEARAMELRLLVISSFDAIVRSGRLDMRPGGLLALEWAMRQRRMGPMSTEEAERLRAILARVRERHPHRLHRPALLALSLLQGSPSEAQDESLDWVCRERVVVMAEALAAIGCESMSTRVCFDRINDTIDALDHRGLQPEWTPLLPPRIRRGRDAVCEGFEVPLRELARRAVLSEIAFSLFDEVIAHSVAGSSLEAAMARPAPTFDGETLERRRAEALGGPRVVFLAPDWIGRGGEGALSLLEPRETTEPR